MKLILNFLTITCILCWSYPAYAHSLWVNVFESTMHKPNHVITMVGNGHKLPVDDFLFSGKTNIPLSNYYVSDPMGKRINLEMPSPEYHKPLTAKDTGLITQSGDLGMNKITFSDEMPQGTYQVVAAIEDKFFTMYVDDKGKTRHAVEAMDALPKGTKVLRSLRFTSNAKSFFTRGKWTFPKPVGYEMEILPETDLNTAHVGAIVRFKVLMNGKPLSSTFKGVEYLTAHSPAFGDPDKYCLMSILMDGRGQFRIPAAGQWMVKVNVERDISDSSDLSHLKGKAETAYYSATYTFNATP